MRHRRWPDRDTVLARSARIVEATEVLERVEARDRNELGAMLCLARSRRLLAATAQLIESSLPDTCGGLVRQIFELVTAGTCWLHGKIESHEHAAHYRRVADEAAQAKPRNLIRKLFGEGKSRRIAFDDLWKRCMKLLEGRPDDAKAFRHCYTIVYTLESHFSIHAFGSMNRHLLDERKVQLVPQEPGDAVDLLDVANDLVTFLALEIATLGLSPAALGVPGATNP